MKVSVIANAIFILKCFKYWPMQHLDRMIINDTAFTIFLLPLFNPLKHCLVSNKTERTRTLTLVLQASTGVNSLVVYT